MTSNKLRNPPEDGEEPRRQVGGRTMLEDRWPKILLDEWERGCVYLTPLGLQTGSSAGYEPSGSGFAFVGLYSYQRSLLRPSL
ncbi:unnamed protein product [Nezara viridula]|uniref:Uncharacterized protein n=1 Tax=Nezara viridula TaxID=85310 RepID=A0A9P0HJ38_NEZVI|nr:unnamed protein product [Nezara viridula]